MGEWEENIEKSIRNKVFDGCFRATDKKRYERGRDILYKYYLQYYNTLNNMETKRMIGYNLIFAERMLKNEEAVGKYVLQLKNDMDNTYNYKEDHAGEYIDMMSYYTDCKEIILTKKELIDHYTFSYNYYKKVYEFNDSINIYI